MRNDQDLALEAGEAYTSLARVQGVPSRANLGQPAQAEESLKKAESLLASVLARSARNRRAILAAAENSHDRMVMAESDHRQAEALRFARETVARVDSLGALSANERHQAVMLLYNVSLAHKNMHQYGEAIRYARRSVAFSRSESPHNKAIGAGLSIVADALRLSGDLDGAAAATREARSEITQFQFKTDVERFSFSFNCLWREGLILGQEGGISLGRSGEAIEVLQQAFALIEEWSQRDPRDAASRALFASCGRELGAVLTPRDPRQALAVYDRSIAHLREIPQSNKSRRGEAELLAGSANALRRLHRVSEAQDRIEAAFRLLRAVKDYPAERINPDGEISVVVRAHADHLAETGHHGQAAAVYEELLDKMAAAKADPRNDLSHANRLAQTYGTLSGLYASTGQPDKAGAMSTRRLEIWRHWDAKLPGNAFVGRQLAAAKVP